MAFRGAFRLHQVAGRTRSYGAGLDRSNSGRTETHFSWTDSLLVTLCLPSCRNARPAPVSPARVAKASQGRTGPRTNRPLPYRVFRMVNFQMILTFTSRITTISGRKIEGFDTSFLLLVSRRGRFPAGFSILGQSGEQSLDAGRSPDLASQQTRPHDGCPRGPISLVSRAFQPGNHHVSDR